MKPSLELIEVLGAETPIQSAGNGTPLLILEGANNVEGWIPVHDRLSEQFRVLLIGHPGYGGRPTPPWLNTVSDMANFYLDVLDRLDLRAVHLVGFSIGGWIAAELSTRNTTRLQSLTLIAPPGLRHPNARGLDLFLHTEEQRLKDLVFDPDLGEKLIAANLSADTEDQRLHGEVTTAKLAWQPRWFHPALANWLHRIDIPTAIIWGKNDRFMPVELGEVWHKAIPRSTLHVIDNCGHLPQIERSDALVEILETFLNTTRSRT